MFEQIMEAIEKDEFIAIEGAICHWHLRKDGQLTIREIIVLPEKRGQGIGSAILRRLEAIEGASSLVAKCPADLPSNAWYAKRGFCHARTETTKTGRLLNVWVKDLSTQYSLSDLDNHWSHEK